MNRIQTFIKYFMWIAIFYVFSNFLIDVGLNSMYSEIVAKNEYSDIISVEQAEATRVNGRIRGVITNEGLDDINGKYVKVDFYSERNNNMGTKYVYISNVDRYESKAFEILFEASNVDSYTIEIVDEKVEIDTNWFNIDFEDEDGTNTRLLFSAMIILLPLI